MQLNIVLIKSNKSFIVSKKSPKFPRSWTHKILWKFTKRLSPLCNPTAQQMPIVRNRLWTFYHYRVTNLSNKSPEQWNDCRLEVACEVSVHKWPLVWEGESEEWTVEEWGSAGSGPCSLCQMREGSIHREIFLRTKRCQNSPEIGDGGESVILKMHLVSFFFFWYCSVFPFESFEGLRVATNPP